MRTPKLEARIRASAAVARMFLAILRAIAKESARTNISTVLPGMLIVMVSRLNDDEGKPPLSISEIMRLIGSSRQTVRRRVDRLVERGAVVRQHDGIVSSDAYLLKRIDAPYFKVVVAAIRAAAKELEDYK